jgi:hypothetical protein
MCEHLSRQGNANRGVARGQEPNARGIVRGEMRSLRRSFVRIRHCYFLTKGGMVEEGNGGVAEKVS